MQGFVKQTLANGVPAVANGAAAGGPGLQLLPWPKVDFAQLRSGRTRPADSRIQKLSGPNLARNWVMIPHVTQHDDADVTDLEAFRVALNGEQKDVKVTMLALMIKASVAALKNFPDVNASLDGDELVRKQYYNIGFAADTPNGLVVPVVRDADKKGVLEIATRPRRPLEEGARRQAGSGRHERRDVYDLEPGRHRRHLLHADHQRTRSRDPRRIAAPR